MKRILAIGCLLAASAFAQEWAWPVLARQASKRGAETSLHPYPASIYRYEWAEQTNALGFYADTSAIGTNYGVSGTGTARPTWQAPYRLVFDGGDWVRGTNWAALSSLNVTAITLVGWAKVSNPAANQYFAGWSASGTNSGFGTTGSKFFALIGNTAFQVGSPTTNWTHIAAAWHSGGAWSVWINSAIAGTGAHTIAYGAWAGQGSANLHIGERADGQSRYNGTIGEFLLFTNFATSEISAHYNKTKARFE